MQRHLQEVILSQNRMLLRRGRPFDPEQDAGVARLLARRLEEIRAWLRGHPSFDWIEVEYRQAVVRPLREAGRTSEFIGVDLDVERMAAALERTLYRNRV